MELHSLLARQIKKCNLTVSDFSDFDEKYKRLIQLVNETYLQFEEDLTLLERSIDISSREYAEKIDTINNLQASLISNEKMAGIGQLSAGIAHEINNPLGFIQSNIETLSKYLGKIQTFYQMNIRLLYSINQSNLEQNQEIAEEFNSYSKINKIDNVFRDLPDIIDETLEGIHRINKIVKSLLSFSRTGLLNEFEEYDLNKGIKDTITIAYNEIKYYARIEYNLQNIPMLLVKPGEINQVLLNMFMNAVYAIRSNEVDGVISISTYTKDFFACCEISDNGCGISQENLSHIFEPFFTTKPVGSGTGLGLSIAYDIVVNKHRGKFDVKSELNKGTNFKIFLPIVKEDK